MDIQEQEKMEKIKSADIDKISIVYLYKEYDNEHPNPEVNQISDWKIQLRTAFAYFKAGCQKVYSGADLVTCEVTNPFKEFMAARTSVYAKARQNHRGNMIFLDTDVLPYFPLPTDFWKGDWDIALTGPNKDWALMPFNEGIFFAKDTPAAIEFMNLYTKAACHTAQGLVELPTAWWIGQLALGHAYTALNGRGVNFKILEDRRYNFVPDKPVATNAYFIHFKGARKPLMRQYLAGLLGTDYIDVKPL